MFKLSVSEDKLQHLTSYIVNKLDLLVIGFSKLQRTSTCYIRNSFASELNISGSNITSNTTTDTKRIPHSSRVGHLWTSLAQITTLGLNSLVSATLGQSTTTELQTQQTFRDQRISFCFCLLSMPSWF